MAMVDREVSYADLARDVESCAAWMRREGCIPSEIVGITIADEYLHMVACLALLWLGVPQVSLSSHDPAPMRQELVRRLPVGRLFVTDSRFALDGVAISLLTRDALRTLANAPSACIADPDAPAIHFVSSGTTGVAKVYALSQRMLAWRAERMAESEGIAPGYRGLTLTSVEDAPGKSKRLTCACLGVTSVFRTTPPSSSVPAVCAALHVTCLELNVLQAMSIVHDQADASRFPAGTTVYVSGSQVPAQLRKAFSNRFAIPLYVHYGAREFGRISTTFPGGHDEALDSVGTPVPWIDLEIVDTDGNVLTDTEIGELRVRSPHMISGYHRDPVATARHFRDGWFYPGDLASISRDGALRLHGRTDDMMNLNSIKIFPAEIERVLEEHPAVKSAAAFAKSSPVHGDIPVAAVELHESATVAVDELLARAPARRAGTEKDRHRGRAAAQRRRQDPEAAAGRTRRARQVTNPSLARRAVFEALKVAAPTRFDERMQRSYLSEGSNIDLATLEMDSLGEMEFCIAIELSTGITLLPAQLAMLVTTDAIEEFLRARLAAAPGGR